MNRNVELVTRMPAAPALAGMAWVFMALSAAPRVHAQEAGADSARVTLAAEAEGRLLRVHHSSGRLFIGSYAELTGDSLRLEPRPREYAGPRAFDLADVTQVDARGRGTVPGAWIGGVVGGLVGAYFGSWGAAWCDSDCRGLVVGVGLLGAGGGAAFGALVGTAFQKWDPIWP